MTRKGWTPGPCGTSAKYLWHRRRGENCSKCRAAHAEMVRANYRRKYPLARQFRSRGQALEARRIMLEAKLSRGGCEDCQRPITLDNYFAFDLDHINPEDKLFTISVKYKHVSFETLRAEIAKCRLLCAYCHRIRTHRDRHHLIQLRKQKRTPQRSIPTLFDESAP